MLLVEFMLLVRGCGPIACVTMRALPVVATQFKAVKPVGDRVLVKVDKDEMKSIGGVLLPANAAKKPTAGSIGGCSTGKEVTVSRSS